MAELTLEYVQRLARTKVPVMFTDENAYFERQRVRDTARELSIDFGNERARQTLLKLLNDLHLEIE